MLFFTIPRVFEGHYGVIQHNAIKSWTLLEPRPRIIFTGIDEPSVRDVAAQYGAEAVETRRSEEGIPLVNSSINLAMDRREPGEIMMCANADGIYFGVMEAAQVAGEHLEEFMLVGQRHDVDVTEPLDFSGNWQEHLLDLDRDLFGPCAVDYFMFRGDFLLDMPDFAVGRTSYDNWAVWRALEEGVPVIDATDDVLLLHQRHDRPSRRSDPVKRNRDLLWQDLDGRYGVNSATWRLTDGELCSL